MHVFNGFIDKPLLPSLSLVSVEIFEVLESPEVQGGLLVQDLAFSDFNHLDLSSGHKKASFPVQPALASLPDIPVTVYSIFFGLKKQRIIRQHDYCFNPLLNLFLYPRLIRSGSLEQVLIIYESFLVPIPYVHERSQGFQHESFIVFEEYEFPHILVQLLIGVQGEGVGVALLSPDL